MLKAMDTTSHSTPSDENPGLGAGSAVPPPPPPPPPMSGPRPGSVDHLHRVGHGRMIAGVAGGMADYFDIDPTIVRIGFVVLAFMGGLAIPAYIAGWVLIPDERSGSSVAEDVLDRHHYQYS